MKDLTILFLTVNLVPKEWAKYQKEVLLVAVGDLPIITISREPLDWGINIIQNEDISAVNVYKQILRGTKLATTKYIAIAEDDSLYPQEHFLYYPNDDEILYNLTCWQLQTWNPIYYLRLRHSNSVVIAPRQLMIDALEERFNKYPDLPHFGAGELGRYSLEQKLKISHIKTRGFYTKTGVVHFQHPYSMDPLEQKLKKKIGPIRAYDIPYWGPATELVKKFI